MELSILDALNISLTGFVVVLIILALLAVIIVLLSKVIRVVEGIGNKKEVDEEPKVVSAPTVTPAPAPVVPTAAPVAYCGGVELYKTDLKTAAMAMAIVSHESGIPLERLQFTSIRLVDDVELYKTDDKTAATIMAIVSHQSGIPLDRLVFKSIKLIEE